MADYAPPAGVVDLDLTGDYSPPAGVVDLDIGADSGNNRSLAIAVRTGGAVAAIRVRLSVRATVAARTGGARAIANIAYDPNLLSAVHAVTTIVGATGGSPLQTGGSPLRWREAARLPGAAADRWTMAVGATGGSPLHWRDSARLSGIGLEAWRDAESRSGSGEESWRQGGFVARAGMDAWREGSGLRRGETAVWIMTLPRLTPDWRLPWSQGATRPTSRTDRFGDGALLISREIERWRQAGYPANAPNPGPPKPPPDPPYDPPVGVVNLELRCPLVRATGGSPVPTGPINLNFGRSPCPAWPAVNVPELKVYRVLNSCSLVRLPDRAPLAVTAMTVETDADSWCWALSATLAGPDGWTLLQPQPPAFLPVEVEATINGHAWRFLLDAPSASRKFNESRQSLRGRSRTAWLADPFTAPSSGVEAYPRTAQQLAEQALENLGWTLVWNLPADWLIPGGLYAWSGTPIDQLSRLVKPVDGCLYTDPSAAILTAYPRYPTAAWLWDGETADVGIPEAAVISLDRSPENRPVLNGCYVSGTLYGNVAWVKIAGTDGALVPAEPIVDPLLCHVDALRARGVAVLSAAGPGHALSADLLLTAEGGTGPGLLRPGLLADIAGVRGMVRSVRVSAAWSNGLTVRQQVGIERREVES